MGCFTRLCHKTDREGSDGISVGSCTILFSDGADSDSLRHHRSSGLSSATSVCDAGMCVCRALSGNKFPDGFKNPARRPRIFPRQTLISFYLSQSDYKF